MLHVLKVTVSTQLSRRWKVHFCISGRTQYCQSARVFWCCWFKFSSFCFRFVCVCVSEKLIYFVNLFRFARLLAKEHIQPFFITGRHNASFRNFNDSLLENVAFYPANDLFSIKSERLLNSHFRTWRVNMEVTLGNPAVIDYYITLTFTFWVRRFSCLL